MGSQPGGGLDLPLSQTMPPSIHFFRHTSYVNPRSSSETPNWKPHDGQISKEPPSDRRSRLLVQPIVATDKTDEAHSRLPGVQGAAPGWLPQYVDGGGDATKRRIRNHTPAFRTGRRWRNCWCRPAAT